jgi:hypothetical protein
VLGGTGSGSSAQGSGFPLVLAGSFADVKLDLARRAPTKVKDRSGDTHEA